MKSPALQQALEYHRAGDLSLAAKLYVQVLQEKPDQPEALHLLGLLQHQQGAPKEALVFLSKAASAQPTNSGFHDACGNAHMALENWEEAIDCYRRALELTSELPETLLHQAQAFYNVGASKFRESAHLEAIEYFQLALKNNPSYARAHTSMGLALQHLGRFDEALPFLERAIQLEPSQHEAHTSLGNLLLDLHKIQAAIQSYEKAIALQPANAGGFNNLGVALQQSAQFTAAIHAYQQALRINPNHEKAHNNLGHLLHECGRIDEALTCYRQAIRIKPNYQEAHSNLLFSLHHHPALEDVSIFQEHCAWANRHEIHVTNAPSARLSTDPARRLRIGYVSPDFSRHVNARLLEVFLSRHNREEFEVFSYSTAPRTDEVTSHLRSLSDHWRDLRDHGDSRAAQLIGDDQIDILVDLAGHTAFNRLSLFSHQPAAVQVSFLGYVATTGMKSIAYRLTDDFGDPHGLTEAFYTEQLIRLPGSVICYQAPKTTPNVTPLPALERGFVTFGCFNNLAKINDPLLEVWSRILQNVPNSRLLIKAKPVDDTEIRGQLLARFKKHGIGGERLDIRGWVTGNHLLSYHEVDLGLDPFPFNGGATSFESLWMGVPFISLTGHNFVSRMGVRHLSCVGLADFIADDVENYISLAIEKAQKMQNLSSLRRELRARLLSSPLMDGPNFVGNLERAYRSMWEKWCAQK